MTAKHAALMHTTRALVQLIVATTVGLAAAWGASDTASAAEPERPAVERRDIPGSPAAARCVMDSAFVNCDTAAATKVRQFRTGRLGRSRGVPVGRAFRAPKVAKELWVNRITYKLKRRGKTALDRYRTTVPSARECTHERCVAYRMYSEWQHSADCAGEGNVASRADNGLCIYHGQAELTKEQIQRGGSLILCGGGVVIGVASTTATAGSTAFIAGWGAAACGWSFWMSF